MKRLYPPEKWDPNWIPGYSETEAEAIARTCPHKTWDRFLGWLVSAFGAMDYEPALYLWRKIHPGKPPKFIIV